MINFFQSKIRQQKVNQSILIIGPARSGTTITGKLINSLKNVEYAFEPPMLNILFNMIDELEENKWKVIFSTYIYEEILLGSITGRYINCNIKDDSSIYNVKSKTEINNRLHSTHRYKEIGNDIQRSTIAYKYNTIFSLLKFISYYPDVRIVFVKREPIGVLNSIIRKQWYSDESIMMDNIGWPRIYHNGRYLPSYLNKNEFNSWIKLSEYDRCAVFYTRFMKMIKEIDPFIILDYDQILKNPQTTITKLSKKLGLTFGAKTYKILQSVKPTNSSKDMDIMNKLSRKYQRRIEFYL